MCFSIGDRADGASAAKTLSAFYLKEMFLVATILVFLWQPKCPSKPTGVSVQITLYEQCCN